MHSGQFPLGPSCAPHCRQHRLEISLHVVQHRSVWARRLLHCLGKHCSNIMQIRFVRPGRSHLLGQKCLRPAVRVQKLRTAQSRCIRSPCAVGVTRISEFDFLPRQPFQVGLALPSIPIGTFEQVAVDNQIHTVRRCRGSKRPERQEAAIPCCGPGASHGGLICRQFPSQRLTTRQRGKFHTKMSYAGAYRRQIAVHRQQQ